MTERKNQIVWCEGAEWNRQRSKGGQSPGMWGWRDLHGRIGHVKEFGLTQFSENLCFTPSFLTILEDYTKEILEGLHLKFRCMLVR